MPSVAANTGTNVLTLNKPVSLITFLLSLLGRAIAHLD
jgi:hypothetical protein